MIFFIIFWLNLLFYNGCVFYEVWMNSNKKKDDDANWTNAINILLLQNIFLLHYFFNNINIKNNNIEE